jgi:hypothetical protein
VFELSDRSPVFAVPEAEYRRLLGFPSDYEATDRVRELNAWARRWYRDHGRPWWYARRADALALGQGTVTIEGATFAAPGLHDRLRRGEADTAILVAVSAGEACEAHARTLWEAGRPDEYFFLEVYGSAVVEALISAASYRLCEWADGRGWAVLPHYSPGYPEWDIAEQQRLFQRVAAGRDFAFGDRLRVLESGMLSPKKSLLAVFGVTSRAERVQPLTSLVPCENCALSGCRYRRVPYRRPPPTLEALPTMPPPAGRGGLTRDAAYTVGAVALAKWARERLTLRVLPDRSVEARFRYDGTTCSSMGQPLAFDYHVWLAAAEEGYTIRDARCVPSPGDVGHTYMCQFLIEQSALLDTIAGERPLAGRPLDDVLRWRRALDPAGCYCEAAARAHKWGMVLEVIHFALARSAPPDAT